MNSLVIAAVSAVVGSIITAFSGLPRVLWGRARQHWEPDHGALYHGSWALTSTSSGDGRMRVQIACAPDSSLGLTAIAPDKAIALIRSAFPDEFQGDPVFSMPGHGVRFEKGDRLNDGYTWVWTCGRIDYDFRFDPVCVGDNVHFPIEPILGAISKVANIVSSKQYHDLYSDSSKRIRRFDWFIGVSPSVVTADGITREWTDVLLPGRSPSRVSSVNHTFCPSDGYAASALRSWDPHKGRPELLSVFLKDFLEQNGYYDCDGPISDAVESFERLTQSSA